MDKSRSIKNVAVSIFFRLFLFIGSFLVRRFLIQFIGNDINGIDSLYTSIIGVLAVAELGIGDAIIFCMYKPIVEGRTDRVGALYGLFQRAYRIVGLFIAVAGCAVMPFLPQLAKGYSTAGVNLYVTFGLMLVSVTMSYMFSADSSLMNAYRDNYITTTISSGGQLFQQIIQIVVLIRTRSFECYLLCRILSISAQWIITKRITRKRYAPVLSARSAKIDKETKKEVIQKVKATFMHQIGNVLVNTIDSIIISAFIGVAILGKYTNYTTIVSAMLSVLSLFFQPLSSSIGHLFVQDKTLCKRYYHFFYTFNYILGCVFFLGYYSIIDDLIFFLFGDGLAVSRSISFVITVNYFIQYMRQATMVFRNATGTFYYDRWKPLFEGLSNLVLSIIFVKIFQSIAGDDFAVVGVIVATIITNLLICHVVEPYVLHRYAFEVSTKRFWLKNYGYIALFVVMLTLLTQCTVTQNSRWLQLLENGCIAVGLSLLPVCMAILLDKDFLHFAASLFQKKKS